LTRHSGTGNNNKILENKFFKGISSVVFIEKINHNIFSLMYWLHMHGFISKIKCTVIVGIIYELSQKFCWRHTISDDWFSSQLTSSVSFYIKLPHFFQFSREFHCRQCNILRSKTSKSSNLPIIERYTIQRRAPPARSP